MSNRHTTMVSNIAQELRARILTGEIRPGEFLESQKVLADQFGVGLSTVREAVQTLAAVGLVESHPGKGTWVRQDALTTLFDPAAVKSRLGELRAEQVYEARSVIEVGLTVFAAQRATPDDIRAIWDALEAMQAAIEKDSKFVEADLEFHLAVARAGHNELLEQFYHLVRKLLSEVITEMVMLPRVKEESILLQRAIAEAIEAQDPMRAEEAALQHMRYIEELLNAYG